MRISLALALMKVSLAHYDYKPGIKKLITHCTAATGHLNHLKVPHHRWNPHNRNPHISLLFLHKRLTLFCMFFFFLGKKPLLTLEFEEGGSSDEYDVWLPSCVKPPPVSIPSAPRWPHGGWEHALQRWLYLPLPLMSSSSSSSSSSPWSDFFSASFSAFD